MSDHPLGRVVEEEVKRAEADLSAFRSRALSLVGLTGVLVTFVSGLVAIAVGEGQNVLPRHGPAVLGVALTAYVLSAVCALLANVPGDASAAEVEPLEQLVRTHWDDTGWDQQSALMLTKYLRDLRSLNTGAATWLTRAIALEIVGIAATAVLGLATVNHVT